MPRRTTTPSSTRPSSSSSVHRWSVTTPAVLTWSLPGPYVVRRCPCCPGSDLHPCLVDSALSHLARAPTLRIFYGLMPSLISSTALTLVGPRRFEPLFEKSLYPRLSHEALQYSEFKAYLRSRIPVLSTCSFSRPCATRPSRVPACLSQPPSHCSSSALLCPRNNGLNNLSPRRPDPQRGCAICRNPSVRYDRSSTSLQGAGH